MSSVPAETAFRVAFISACQPSEASLFFGEAARQLCMAFSHIQQLPGDEQQAQMDHACYSALVQVEHGARHFTDDIQGSERLAGLPAKHPGATRGRTSGAWQPGPLQMLRGLIICILWRQGYIFWTKLRMRYHLPGGSRRSSPASSFEALSRRPQR